MSEEEFLGQTEINRKLIFRIKINTVELSGTDNEESRHKIY